MKEKIYTIPVNEAFEKECSCPFCAIYTTLEKDFVDFTLGPSYMESYIRDKTNKYGFCKTHYDMMTKGNNFLGLSLMSKSHLKEVINNIEATSKLEPKNKLFTKGTIEPLSTYLSELENTCYICEGIEKTFNLYIDTFFYLYKNDPSFKYKIKGFCLSHFNMLVAKSYTTLKPKDFFEFKTYITEIELKVLNTLYEDLELYSNKFDYKFKDIPYGNSKTSISRTYTTFYKS
ncbi:MAG: DUF6062 family protein [Lachnospirales bacterium]